MKIVSVIGMALMLSLSAIAQVGINTNGSAPDSSAMLDVKSSSRGFLLSRMTTWEQRYISNPSTGLLIFNTDSLDFWYLDGSRWLSFDINPNDTIYDWQCGDSVDYEGQSYSTVQIGTQCWIAENLNVGIFIPGSSTPTNNDTIEKYCYANNTSNCSIYGAFYTWNEMMGYSTDTAIQGICPPG